MEPVIKKQITYSVLFMRDDCGVMRFRLRAFWLKVLAVLSMLVLLTAVGATWGAYYFWKKHSLVQSEYKGAEQELLDMRNKLSSLQNMEKIRLENDPSHTRTIMERVSAENATAKSSAPAPSALTAKTPAGTAQAATNATMPETPATSTDTPARQPDPVPDPEHPAKISKMFASGYVANSGASRLRISFDLTNQFPQTLTLSGKVQLAVVTTEGTIVDIPGSDRDLRFQINRLKSVATTIVLPTDMALSSVQSIQVTVEAEGQPAYVERFPFPTPQQ